MISPKLLEIARDEQFIEKLGLKPRHKGRLYMLYWMTEER